jgi:hypothetical protein
VQDLERLGCTVALLLLAVATLVLLGVLFLLSD